MYLLRRIIGADSIKPRVQTSKLHHAFGRRGCAKGHFNMVCGVAVTSSGQIVVADTENHRIQIFTPNGHFLTKFGHKGPGADQLNCPTDVVATSDDHIVLTDTVNGCVKKFNQSGDLLQILGDDSFQHPHGLAIAHDDWLVVSDICRHNITVLTSQGFVYKQFGSYGDGLMEFDHPQFVTFTKQKQILVSDHGNVAVKIFTTEGELLKNFTMFNFKIFDEHFITLQGVTVDDDNNVLIIGNCTVYILTATGRMWEVVLPSEGLFNPRCIAYSKSGHLIVTQSGVGQEHRISVFNYNKKDYKALQMFPTCNANGVT